ncbi:hypothetical protein B0O80DRAFT_460770 [Mortierella sp. GBAus27b]|nr:hypothetical protein B0O80DRAFT_460770 [Mortierella sp. GBAus27b]
MGAHHLIHLAFLCFGTIHQATERVQKYVDQMVPGSHQPVERPSSSYRKTGQAAVVLVHLVPRVVPPKRIPTS